MKIPAERAFSLGRLKCLALGVASVNNTRLFTLLNFKRTRTENLLILRWSENRLSQVLTLFYSRIPEQNFLFDMIYDCLFESVWFTFREQVAPAPNQNLDKIKAFRLSASCHSYYEWQAAGSRIRQHTNYKAGAMTIISMMIDDCPLEMIYDSLFGSRAVSIGR